MQRPAYVELSFSDWSAVLLNYWTEISTYFKQFTGNAYNVYEKS